MKGFRFAALAVPSRQPPPQPMPSPRLPMIAAPRRRRPLRVVAAGLLLGAAPGVPAAGAAPAVLSLDALPRPAAAAGPASVAPSAARAVVPAQVLGWRREAAALEHGDQGLPRDPQRAAELYCRAARHGDAESQYSLAWMLTNARGIDRDDAAAAHLFAAAAEQGHLQAANMARTLGTPRGQVPRCLQPPTDEPATADAGGVGGALEASGAPGLAVAPGAPGARGPLPGAGAATAPAGASPPGQGPWVAPPRLPPNAPEPIVRFVELVAPEYRLEPHLVLAVMATESNFDPWAVSPKNALGLMQLIPDTARRFRVADPMDPTQNIRGGMAYLRWLLAYFEGDLRLALAAYNAGEGAVERYRGVPPFAETRLYVRKIIAMLGGRQTHPFDASVTPPSSVLPLIRGPVASR